MSVDATLADEIKPETKTLFENYRNGSIATDETVELFQFLCGLKDKYGKAFKLRVLLADLEFNQFDIKRLDSEWFRWRKRQGKTDSSEVPQPSQGITTDTEHEQSRSVSRGASKALFSEIQEIGNLLVTQFSKNAAERGETLKEYVLNCIELREQSGDQIEAIQQENDVLKTLCGMFAQAVKPQFKQLAVTRMYLDWTTGLMQLQALGVEVNQPWVDEITSRIETALNIRIM